MAEKVRPVIKQVMGISLGSSARDAERTFSLGASQIHLVRLGTDGNLDKAKALFKKYDGKVDAFGLGGTDLYLFAGTKKYLFKESAQIISQVQQTPVVDGSGIKNTWERKVIQDLAAAGKINFVNKRVLLVCAVDRFGMAQALAEQSCSLVMGDLLFGLKLNFPIRSLQTLDKCARLLVPVISRLPVRFFYPLGDKQQVRQPLFSEYFMQSDVIAGDFHFIRRFMPDRLPGKIIITNTATEADRTFLQAAGVAKLVTTTPCLEGRSFGTNMLEASLVALAGAHAPLEQKMYLQLLNQLQIHYACTDFPENTF